MHTNSTINQVLNVSYTLRAMLVKVNKLSKQLHHLFMNT